MDANGKELALRGEHLALRYNNQKKLFGRQKNGFWAIKDISLSLYQGECLGVIGRNGAGKSSLMRLLAGILAPDEGSITYYRKRITLLSLGVGFVKHLSGRDNAILGGMLLGLSKRQMLDRIAQIKDYSELGEFFDEPLFTYSSGMRARLGFSTAIQSDPEIILIDEMLGVGDQNFRDKSSRTMRELITGGKTVVLITHNRLLVKELCDRALWIQDGSVVAEGDTFEVVDQYIGSLPSSLQ